MSSGDQTTNLAGRCRCWTWQWGAAARVPAVPSGNARRMCQPRLKATTEAERVCCAVLPAGSRAVVRSSLCGRSRLISWCMLGADDGVTANQLVHARQVAANQLVHARQDDGVTAYRMILSYRPSGGNAWTQRQSRAGSGA